MICTGCARDRIALLITTIELERVDQRTGRVKRETRTTRLCCSCCGDESPVERSPGQDVEGTGTSPRAPAQLSKP